MPSTNFYYNGEYSGDHGIYIVNVDNNLLKDPFLSNRSLVTEQIPGNNIPYLYDVTRSPLQLTLTLSTLDNGWSFDKRREIAKWLDTDNFEEFYTDDNPEKRYYLMYDGSSVDLNYAGNMEGYIQITMTNISPYSYSPYYSQTFDCSANDVTTITFDNDGDDLLCPEIQINKIGDGDVSIINLTNGGTEFKFTSLLDGENVYVDNLNHMIETDALDTNRYNNFNFNYLELVRGTNRLQVTGKCSLLMKYQFTYKG